MRITRQSVRQQTSFYETTEPMIRSNPLNPASILGIPHKFFLVHEGTHPEGVESKVVKCCRNFYEEPIRFRYGKGGRSSVYHG